MTARLVLALLALPALLASAACAPRARPAAPATPEQDVQAALAHYADLVQKMDSPGIAAMFAPDGEIVNPGQTPVHGPAAIEAFLKQFEGFKVLSETMTADTTTVTGASAVQTGSYRQTVRTPDGQTLNVSGGFEAEWIRDAAGVWRLRRLGTKPSARQDAVS